MVWLNFLFFFSSLLLSMSISEGVLNCVFRAPFRNKKRSFVRILDEMIPIGFIFFVERIRILSYNVLFNDNRSLLFSLPLQKISYFNENSTFSQWEARTNLLSTLMVVLLGPLVVQPMAGELLGWRFFATNSNFSYFLRFKIFIARKVKISVRILSFEYFFFHLKDL